MKDYNFLAGQIRDKKSYLCVGLDPDPLKMPGDFSRNDLPLYLFSKAIVELTHEFAVAFKINVAFFEAYGPSGWEQLAMTLSAIPKECLIILDAKRADIGNTSARYAQYYFEVLNADAVTLHPYMGLDSLDPFLCYAHKWSAILALTSNPGSADFQLQPMREGLFLYEKVIQTFAAHPNPHIMFVCGATHPEAFSSIRNLCPDRFLLVPGIGAQGGDLEEVIRRGRNDDGGLLINVSRGICYPDGDRPFDESVKELAFGYQRRMARVSFGS
ncbi:MAG: orotidine-5'-phosphate decarboxylase [Saprospiraceae bacterium]|nr:orotidine-5'-phosphate decarboxylase [Saprospiraceae bacterium]